MRVCIAGGFDPFHDGHWDHIQKAYALGDWLFIITHPDELMIKKKGYCSVSLNTRIAILKGLLLLLGGKGEVVVSIDADGTVAKTLKNLKPDIFAKGGDRILGTLPDNEVKVCAELDIQIIYGVGNKLGSSQEIVKRAIGMLELKGGV